MPRTLLVLVAPLLAAADWPQWRGPDRTGVSAETGWLAGWPEKAAPPVAWRAQVGRGHAAVSVARGRAYTLGWDGAKDTVFCLDAATGREVWRDSYPTPGIAQWPGPRATPVVTAAAVYTLSLDGHLRAYHPHTGKLRWAVRLPKSYSPDEDYGFAWTPVVEGDLLILPVGKSGAAVRTADGSFAWGDDGVHGACASPVPYTRDGTREVALVTTNPGRESVAVVGIDPLTGAQRWRLPAWPEKWGAACADPVVRDGKLFVTTAEQHPRGGRFALGPGGVRPEWEGKALACYTAAPVLIGNHLYGVGRPGLLKCVDWTTGREAWAERGFGDFGSVIAADGLLLVQASGSGRLAVAKADPAGYDELRSAPVFTGRADTFTPPALANGRVYCRSYAGEVVCLRTGADR
jgi:outer membrane protein assembly factor BamB